MIGSCGFKGAKEYNSEKYFNAEGVSFMQAFSGLGALTPWPGELANDRVWRFVIDFVGVVVIAVGSWEKVDN